MALDMKMGKKRVEEKGREGREWKRERTHTYNLSLKEHKNHKFKASLGYVVVRYFPTHIDK